ncbi:MAG: hypothetical protein JXQ65_03655 [Candidatus Marinimicrobia bacterium]|nr:hypothetical protein [Candidatus Neomarinimicrobiota bacterium]
MKKFGLYLILTILFFGCETVSYVADDEKLFFTTDISIKNITEDSLTVIFSVNKASRCHLYYCDGYNTDSVLVQEFRQNHEITLNDLYAGIHYQIEVRLTEFYDSLEITSIGITAATAENNFSRGWQAFRDGEFETALSFLNTYNQSNPHDPWTISSQGWCLLQTGSYQEAREKFLYCDTLLASEPLHLLGLTLLEQITENYNEALTFGESLLLLHPQWQFLYFTQYNSNLARLILAETSLIMGDFEKSINLLDQLLPENIFYNNSESWVLEGVKYNNLEAFIIAALNFLKSEFYSSFP